MILIPTTIPTTDIWKKYLKAIADPGIWNQIFKGSNYQSSSSGMNSKNMVSVFDDNPDLVALAVRFQIFSSATQRYVLSEYQPILLYGNRGAYL
jgi:hypothetical protein